MFTYPTHLQKHKTVLTFALVLLGFIGLVLLFVGGVSYWRCAQQEKDIRDLNLRLAVVSPDGDEAAAIAELEEIIAAGKDQNLNMSEARYAQLWYQWQSAVNDFKQITAALNNRYLAAGQRQELKAFYSRLLALRDSCAKSLDTGEQMPASLGWKLHNLKGNFTVMLAYSVLSFEEDGRKAAKFLSDAVDDYKASIDIANSISSTAMERSLPRWNMELIIGIGEYRRIGLNEIKQENMTEIQEQLEAFIPDVAGFSPGAPLETRVEK